MISLIDSFPYIGLRPFTEDDSLYFKGRDEQILQLTALLEANKFLMVTGASGDGKSSLVYAGLLPNARAGFFNAKYTKWVVADFRPERTPIRNLSHTMARTLRLEDEKLVEVELQRGFSSLVDLYLTSDLYVDETSEAWQSADEDQRDEMTYKAANLLIVADQFEEFFTNPENYYRNSPSAESQLVINLLLETARISIAKNLPIYVVCTMRSDYIGQCAAFRGLPEFIGFSQFFVPRLKRKEMIQVVKEPAGLHGDKISNRLVERVVYDLGEGIDQLPVLEHAMNEVWIQANNGTEELDLIHYAMAGGMSAGDLPVADRERFRAWFSKLSPTLQDAYTRHGLSHIIDTHANKLYLSAADHYNETHSEKISVSDAQLIIKVAFTCLTKMDGGRAVRNRMTLQEITDILSRPDLDAKIVGGVLNIFREPGNTFLRPYISDDPESRNLDPETVLDITHESLIRNWELLLTWATEEYDHFVVYGDFKKQLDRWIESDKSKGFLLPIGPLTFFEGWHKKLVPNIYWVNRYLDPGKGKDERLHEAREIVDQTQNFLNQSAKRVAVTRMIVKYGATRIAAVLGTLLVLVLCSYYYWDAKLKGNDRVIERILKEGETYISDPKFDGRDKADFVIMKEFMEPGSFRRILNGLPFDQQVKLIHSIYSSCMLLGYEPSIEIESFHYADSILNARAPESDNPVWLMDQLRGLDDLITNVSDYMRTSPKVDLEPIKLRAIARTKDAILEFVKHDFDLVSLDMMAINNCMDHLLNNQALTQEETRSILAAVSPFSGDQSRRRFEKYYPLDKPISYLGFWLLGNGGYQQLAYLYGYLGDLQLTKQCIDSLVAYDDEYNGTAYLFLNIANHLFSNGHIKACDDLVGYFAAKTKRSKREVYEMWLETAGIIDARARFPIILNAHAKMGIELMQRATVGKLFDQYYKVILEDFKNQNELNYELALYYKHRGMAMAKINHDQALPNQSQDSLFSLALVHYRKVASAFLEERVRVFVNINPVSEIQRRKDLFLYPDHAPRLETKRTFEGRYLGDDFFWYIIEHPSFGELYNTTKDFEHFRDWIACYDQLGKLWFEVQPRRNFTVPRIATLHKIDSLFSVNPMAESASADRARLLLIDHYIEQDQEDKVNDVLSRIDLSALKIHFQNLNTFDEQTISFRFLKTAEYLALKGRIEEACQLLEPMTNEINVILSYSAASFKLLKSPHPAPKGDAFVYLDSAITKFERLEDISAYANDPRVTMVLTTSMIGGKDMDELTRQFIQAIGISRQSNVFRNNTMGLAIRNDYYSAYNAVSDISVGDRLGYLNIILAVEGWRRATDDRWRELFEAYQYAWEEVGYELEQF